MLNNKLKSHFKNILWVEVFMHVSCILIVFKALSFFWGYLMLYADYPLEEPGKDRPIMVVGIIYFIMAFYYSAERFTQKKLLHVFSVAVCLLILFMVWVNAFKFYDWYDYVFDIAFIFGTMLAGYALWHEKTYRTIRNRLKK